MPEIKGMLEIAMKSLAFYHLRRRGTVLDCGELCLYSLAWQVKALYGIPTESIRYRNDVQGD